MVVRPRRPIGSVPYGPIHSEWTHWIMPSGIFHCSDSDTVYQEPVDRETRVNSIETNTCHYYKIQYRDSVEDMM